MFRIFAIWLGLLLCPAVAAAQSWPERPVRLIVPYAAGGGTDIVARVLGQKLGEALHQPFLVENKPGASGMIGAGYVAKSDPDGYTLLVASPAEIALNQNLFPSVPYNSQHDFAPITLLAWTPLVLAAHPSFPASTLPELVTLARAQTVPFSTPGAGSSHHLTGEYINKVAKTRLEHVPYRGAALAIQDAVAGQVKLTISGMPPVVPFMNSGALKAIAVASRQRSPAFPKIPAMAETEGFGDFDFTNWFGLLAPAGTPQAVLDTLYKATVAALKTPSVQEVLKSQAAETVGDTPEEFRQFIKDESAKYAKIVAATGVTMK